MSVQPRTTSGLLAALSGVLVLSGCSTGAAPAADPLPAGTASPGASATSSAADCPPPTEGRDAFPAGLPADFPADFPSPDGAADAVADDSDPAVVSARFPSPISLRDSVVFVLEQLPASGFEITGGDSEPHEADVIFARGDLRGQMRIARVDDCTTFWLVQVVRPG